MKTRGFASILLFALFYTTLLSTMVVIPLLLASRDTTGMGTVYRDVPVWERPLNAPSRMNPYGERRQPRSDESVSGPAALQDPVFKSGPDAAMIKPRKARSKTIKM